MSGSQGISTGHRKTVVSFCKTTVVGGPPHAPIDGSVTRSRVWVVSSDHWPRTTSTSPHLSILSVFHRSLAFLLPCFLLLAFAVGATFSVRAELVDFESMSDSDLVPLPSPCRRHIRVAPACIRSSSFSSASAFWASSLPLLFLLLLLLLPLYHLLLVLNVIGVVLLGRRAACPVLRGVLPHYVVWKLCSHFCPCCVSVAVGGAARALICCGCASVTAGGFLFLLRSVSFAVVHVVMASSSSSIVGFGVSFIVLSSLSNTALGCIIHDCK